jgi:RND superfamily putative drug exporter
MFGGLAVVALVALALPVLSMRTAMPSITVVPSDGQSRQGYEQIQAAFGRGAPGALQIVAPSSARQPTVALVQADPGIAESLPPQPGGGGEVLIEAVPTSDPSSPQLGATIDRLRSELPSGTLIGGQAAENHDLEAALAANTPVVIGAVLALGFLLLLIAFQAPVAAAIGVVANLLATGAAFGISKWIFQDGHLAGLLGFQPQGFVDAWAPVFFFAMIFAISMDYTVFLLSSAKEGWDAEHDARRAMVGGLFRSGRVIFAAGAVMVAVFFTFALSGPLAPKEMGVVLGIAVLLDTFVVRLLLVPVLLRLAGPAAWYAPRWLARILPDVRFGHGDTTPARSPA